MIGELAFLHVIHNAMLYLNFPQRAWQNLSRCCGLTWPSLGQLPGCIPSQPLMCPVEAAQEAEKSLTQCKQALLCNNWNIGVLSALFSS